MYPSAVRITPDPTPDDGICAKPRDEKPSEVMVTTESRTSATTSVSSGAGAALDAAAATAGAPVGAGDGAERSGPATSAAVPPAASIAESRTTAAMPSIPRPPARRSRRPAFWGGFGAMLDPVVAPFPMNGGGALEPGGVSGATGASGDL